jgi:hypothetical protein
VRNSSEPALYIVFQSRSDYSHGIVGVFTDYKSAKALHDEIYDNMYKCEDYKIHKGQLSKLEKRYCQLEYVEGWRRTGYDWLNIVEIYKYNFRVPDDAKGSKRKFCVFEFLVFSKLMFVGMVCG